MNEMMWPKKPLKFSSFGSFKLNVKTTVVINSSRLFGENNVSISEKSNLQQKMSDTILSNFIEETPELLAKLKFRPAFGLIDKLQASNSKPSAQFYDMLIKNCYLNNRFDLVQRFSAEANQLGYKTKKYNLRNQSQSQDSLFHNEVIQNIISNCKEGKFREALGLFKSEKALGNKPPQAVYRQLIVTFSWLKVNQTRVILKLWKEFQRHQYSPDLFLLNSIIYHLANYGCVLPEIEKILGMMNDEKTDLALRPNELTYKPIVIGCIKAHKWREAKHYLNFLIKYPEIHAKLYEMYLARNRME